MQKRLAGGVTSYIFRFSLPWNAVNGTRASGPWKGHESYHLTCSQCCYTRDREVSRDAITTPDPPTVSVPPTMVHQARLCGAADVPRRQTHTPACTTLAQYRMARRLPWTPRKKFTRPAHLGARCGQKFLVHPSPSRLGTA